MIWYHHHIFANLPIIYDWVASAPVTTSVKTENSKTALYEKKNEFNVAIPEDFNSISPLVYIFFLDVFIISCVIKHTKYDHFSILRCAITFSAYTATPPGVDILCCVGFRRN